MNHLLVAILIGASVVGAETQQVSVSCIFSGAARGYKDLAYSTDMILADNGRIFNDDGRTGNTLGEAMFSEDFGYVAAYNGQEYISLMYTSWRMIETKIWSVSTGTFTCALGPRLYTQKSDSRIHDTVYINKPIRITTYDTIFLKPDTSVKFIRDTVIKIVHDTVIKIVKDTIFDSTKGAQRFSLKGSYVGIAINEQDCDFYAHLIKYQDSVFNENGEYVDSFRIDLTYKSGSFFKTLKIDRLTLLDLIGHPAVFSSRRGNFYITTELDWNQESIKDWTKVKPSDVIQQGVDKLRAELEK